jgi:putative DNA methylase
VKEEIAYPKRLIEVDLPIKRVSKHARDEKDSRCGHIPRLHIYPAARPLAACRAVLCAALWPDPGDPNCPKEFSENAAKEMLKWATFERLQLLSLESQLRFNNARKNPDLFQDKKELRNALLDFIADFSDWKNLANAEFLKTCHSLTQSAHHALGGVVGTRPLVVDPFAGGGAIPLESLRVGAEACASDSNPLSVIINQVILKYSVKFGQRLADEVTKWGNSVNSDIIRQIGRFYPNTNDGKKPIAYLWARTVLSESPDCNHDPIEIPLIRSMWLARKGVMVALRWKKSKKEEVITETVRVEYANGIKKTVRRPVLEIFRPKTSADVPKGTVARNSATCPVTGYTTPARSVQKQLRERLGGASDARLYCVVSIEDGKNGRSYSIPEKEQIEAYEDAGKALEKSKNEKINGFSKFPEEPLAEMSGVFNAPLYGHSKWGSLFNKRQLMAMSTYVLHARKRIEIEIKNNREFGEALGAVLALAIDRLADLNASLCVWQLSTPNTAHVFGRWALPMIMDYGEVNPLAGAGGSPESSVWRISSAIRDIASSVSLTGEVSMCSADTHFLPHDSADLLVTDPPYYNAIPYADISDFFYVWLKRTIGDVFPEYFQGELSPKAEEICEMSGWDPVRYSHKDKKFFEAKMRKTFERAREYVKPTGVGIVVFAHKTTVGWEAMLQALIEAGWIITASWPIDTEMASRLRAKNSAALASSVHLVCRPRESSNGSLKQDETGDWREVLEELPRRIHSWMPRLADEGVVGADAIFACLGPALEIFSRYSRVEKANGEIVKLKEYLEQVWAAVAKEALSVIFSSASAEGFEPEARLIAMWLWTLSAGIQGQEAEDNGNDDLADEEKSSSKAKPAGFNLEYDAARKIAQGLGVNLEALEHLVEIDGSTARLLSVSERAKYLFGESEDEDVQSNKRKKKSNQQELFLLGNEEEKSKSDNNDTAFKPGATVLDRVHQSMLLFGAGRSGALKRLLVDDGAGADARFWRLAQALSALYPSFTDEKRWIDGVLARKKGLGF